MIGDWNKTDQSHFDESLYICSDMHMLVNIFLE